MVGVGFVHFVGSFVGWGWGIIKTDKGDGTQRERRAQGECAFILRGGAGEAGKV